MRILKCVGLILALAMLIVYGALDNIQIKRINKGLKNIERVNNICNKKFQGLKLFIEQTSIEDGTIIFY